MSRAKIGTAGPRAIVLSFSRIARDRRVLRQCELLAQMGASPLVLGYGEPQDQIPHTFEHLKTPQPTPQHRASTVIRQLPGRLGLWAARIGFWSAGRHRWALARLLASDARVVIANDWPALVVAARWKAQTGGYIHYDTHEFATLEFDERKAWRIVYKPFVKRLERAAIASADVVSTVGPRLADELQRYYDLPERPLVIRNIPNRIELPAPTPTSWPLHLLYHGQILRDRGLETLIESIPHWQSQHKLTIRGDGDPAYVEHLRQRVKQLAVTEFVTFEPAVPPNRVMPIAARTADVGVHFTQLETKQRHFSLPNKLFEYIGSGLAVAVSPGADLREIVESYGVGVVSADASPLAVAAAINGLDATKVEHFKAAARRAAGELCWEHERAILRASLEPVLQDAPAAENTNAFSPG
jgi:glycosyltransferase involved in cell wall biosynthesis